MSNNPEFNLHQQIVNSLTFIDLDNNYTLACLRNLIDIRIRTIRQRQGRYRLPFNQAQSDYINRCELQISLLKIVKGWLNLRISSILMQTPPNNYYHDVPSPSYPVSPSDPLDQDPPGTSDPPSTS